MMSFKSTISTILTIGFLLAIFFVDKKNKATAKAQDDILWQAERPLTWADFEAAPDYENNFVKALTASSIRYSYGCQEGEIVFHIEAIFKKDQSWVKEEARTGYHLGHEQLHFDITELYARKLRKALKEENFPCHRMYAFEQTIKEYLRNWRTEQLKYDRETFFSVRKEEQSHWFYDINIQLEEGETEETMIEN